MARPRLVCLILALVTLLLYLRVWHHDFVVYDDPQYVTENRVVQAGLTWAGIKWAFTAFRASNWHPLTWLSHMVDCELFGVDPAAHHLVNVLIHIANTAVLFFLMLRLLGGLWMAGIVTGLFAWHPLHVESVAWIAERKDVLSTFFGLLSLGVYLRYAQQRRLPASFPLNDRLFCLCVLFFALSLLAKPMLVTLPCVFLLLDYWPLKRIPVFRSAAVEKWPLFLLTIASCAVTFVAQRAEAVMDLDQRPLSARVANAILSYGRYLWKTVWPVDLAVIYPLPREIPWVGVLIAGFLLAAITYVVWRQRARRPYLIIGWLWFLGTLVPVIGLVQAGSQAMADRYTYFPLIGIFFAVVLAVRDWASQLRSPRTVYALIAIVPLLACVILTWRQLEHWKNSETLFAHAVAVTKDNDIARINLGVALEKENRMDEALAHYSEAQRINPTRVQVYNNIANVLSALGKQEEALEHYRQALRMRPRAPVAHLNMASLLVQMDRFDEAMQHYTDAARYAPDDPRPLLFMGRARLQRGQRDEAMSNFREALRRDPNDIQTLTLLARALAADENPTFGEEAVALAERANGLTGGTVPFVLDTLAMAYAQAGRFKDAHQIVQRAIDLTVKVGITNELPAMQERLELYRSGRPYREPVKSAQ